MKELLTALSAFQNEVPILYKEAEAGQGSFKYNYVDLPSIIKVINPILAKHKLAFTQSHFETDDRIGVMTRVYHVDTGDFIDSGITSDVIELRGMNRYQSLGSLSTYLRRYDLSTILGLVTEKDTDASGEQVKPALVAGSDAFDKAKEFLRNGGSYEAIIAKYHVATATKNLLMKD